MERANQLIIDDIRAFVQRLEDYAKEDKKAAAEWFEESEEMGNNYLGSARAYEFVTRWLRHYLGD